MAEVIYEDVDIYAREEAAGGLQIHQQDLAISNAMIAWFTSKVGEYIYQPNLGGILDRVKFKLMTPEQTEDITDFFLSELESNFGRVISINFVNVFPDVNDRTYKIEIRYTSKLTNRNNLVQFLTKPKAQESLVREFFDVPYIGENLLNFVLVKLPDQEGIKLVYDEYTTNWVWGPYRFINLQPTDYNFSTIYNVINEY